MTAALTFAGSASEARALAARWPMSEDVLCGAVGGERSLLICTREAGHAGPHVAHESRESAVGSWGARPEAFLASDPDLGSGRASDEGRRRAGAVAVDQAARRADASGERAAADDRVDAAGAGRGYLSERAPVLVAVLVGLPGPEHAGIGRDCAPAGGVGRHRTIERTEPPPRTARSGDQERGGRRAATGGGWDTRQPAVTLSTIEPHERENRQ
jgi:hypothetical protein